MSEKSKIINEKVPDSQVLAKAYAQLFKDYKQLKKQVTELKVVADDAHKNTQWTMDANRRQVLHIQALEAKIKTATELVNALLHPLPKGLKDAKVTLYIAKLEAIQSTLNTPYPFPINLILNR